VKKKLLAAAALTVAGLAAAAAPAMADTHDARHSATLVNGDVVDVEGDVLSDIAVGDVLTDLVDVDRTDVVDVDDAGIGVGSFRTGR